MNTDAKKIIKLGSLIIFFAVIFVFIFFSSQDLIFGVKIKNINLGGVVLLNGASVETEVTDITGNARNAIALSLNGREISTDQKGNFKESLALLPGYNILYLEARDKFGHIDAKNYQLIYQPKNI